MGRRSFSPLTAYALALAVFASLMAMFARLDGSRASTLDDVRTRGHVVCGIVEGTPGFAALDKQGAWAGLDIDFCSSLAAAVFGDKSAVRYKALNSTNRFQALATGDIDLIARAPAWSLSRDTDLGLRLAGPLFHDGQGFLVRRGYAVASVLELSGASVCAQKGTGAEEALAVFFAGNQMRYDLAVNDKWPELVKVFGDGGCTLLFGDISSLALERSRFVNPGDYMILPEYVSREVSGPVVRQGDEQWFSIVRWVLNALVAAEELGITADNAEGLRGDAQASINQRRFLGLEGNLGEAMGLSAEWSFHAVRASGNYGEMFERNLGSKSPLALSRTLNNVASKGGLMYALPIR